MALSFQDLVNNFDPLADENGKQKAQPQAQPQLPAQVQPDTPPTTSFQSLVDNFDAQAAVTPEGIQKDPNTPVIQDTLLGNADKALTRASDIGKESLFNAGKSIAQIPGELLQGASNIILQAFGVSPGGPTVNERIDNTTGVQSIFESDLAKKIIPEVKDKSGLEKFASKSIQLVGESAAFYLTSLGVAGKLLSKADKLKATKSILKEAAKSDIGTSFLKAVFGSVESVSKGAIKAVTGKAPKGLTGTVRSTLAGAAGGELAKTAFPDSNVAEVVGDLVAQVGPGILIKAAVKAIPKGVRQKTLASIFPDEANAKIVEDLKKDISASGGQQLADQNVSASKRTASTINEATGAPIDEQFATDLAGSTNNPAVIEAKKRVTKGLPETNVFSQQERTNRTALNEAVDSITPNAEVSLSQNITAKRLNKVEHAFDKSIKNISTRIKKDTSKLISPLDEQASGIQFRDEIVDIRHIHNKAANNLYKRLDKDLEIDMDEFFKSNEKLVERFKGEIGESSSLGIANKDISEVFKNKGNLSSIGEVVDLRKALSNELRDVSKGATPNLTKAKFLNETINKLDENLDKAISITGAKGDKKLLAEIGKFKRARAFVRKNKQKFDQGIIKKILSTETQGDFRLTDSQILPAIIQAKGINPDFVDKTLKVIRGNKKARKIFADHIRKTALLPKGQGATTKALQSFVDLNKTAINKIPGLKEELGSLLNKKIRLDRKLAGKTKIDTPTNSFRASTNLLLGKSPDKVMNGILQSADSKQNMERAIKSMGGNTAGVGGLQNAFIQEFKKVTGGTIQETNKLNKFLNDNGDAFDVLFKGSPDSKKVLRAIAEGAHIVKRGGIVRTGRESAGSGLFGSIGNSVTTILSKSRILLVDKFGPAIFGTIAAKNILDTGAKISQKTVDSLLAITISDNDLAKTLLSATKSKSENDIAAFTSALATAFNLDGKENK